MGCEAVDISAAERLTTYFDVASLTCELCPGTRVRSENGLFCECDRNNPCLASEGDNCPCKTAVSSEFLYASRDGTLLMQCNGDGDAPYSAADGPGSQRGLLDCKCGVDNHHLVEFVYRDPQQINGVSFDGEKRCIACPPLTYVDKAADAYECLPCPAPDGSPYAAFCSCRPTDCEDTCALAVEQAWRPTAAACQCVNAQEGISLRSCVESKWLEESIPATVGSSYWQMEIVDVDNGEAIQPSVSVASNTFKDVFWPHAVDCFRVVMGFNQESGALQLKRTQSCQALANLCVLQDYNLRRGGVCKLFEDGGSLAEMIENQVVGTKRVNDEMDWLKHLPWLYRDRSIRSSTDKIKLKVGFDAKPESGVVRTLAFKLAAWSLDGTWLGFEDLTTQLDVCSGLPFGTAGNAPDYLNIGYGIRKDCTLNITSLLSGASAPVQKFYDLYLVDADGTLVPTATKLLNYRDSGSGDAVNIDSNLKEDLVDEQFTSRFVLFDRVSALEAADDEYPRVFRYAKSVKLTITVTELGVEPSVFTPIVTIEYGAVDVNQLLTGEWDDGAVVDMSFTAEHVKDLTSYKDTLRIVFAVCCTLCVCEWGVSIVLNSRNRNTAAVDGSFLLRTLFDGIGCAARWMFVLMFFGCFQQWFFFKMQADVNTLLPTAHDIEPFRVMLSTGFIAKLISIAHVLWRQCQVDVFFIDWEKSHGRLVDGGEEGAQKDTMAPVSYWRNIFITNEWSALQTARMVNVELTLLGLVFLLRGLDLDNLATSNPDVEDLRGPEDGGSSIDPILHFFIGSFFIILLSGAQIFFKKIYYHPYVCNPLERFKHLMTCANISAIILSDKFCGHYIGGNGAPHAHVDTNMAGIMNNFKNERESKTRPRGLWSQEPDILSFVLFVTPKIRSLYEGQFNKMESMRNRGMPGDVGENPVFKAYNNLNKMFRKFISTEDAASEYAHEVRLQHADSGLLRRVLSIPSPQLVIVFACCVSRRLWF